MKNCIYFSAAGTTAKITKYFADKISGNADCINLRLEKFDASPEYTSDDIVFFGAPVYMGRIPPKVVKEIKKLNGSGAKAVAIVVYGNRAYDDALVELSDTVKAQGFELVAAAAFVAEHSLMHEVAAGRPDTKDFAKMDELVKLINEKLASGKNHAFNIPGNRPYKGNPSEMKVLNGKGFPYNVLSKVFKLVWRLRKEPEWYL